MLLRIATLPKKYLVGKSRRINFAENKTGELWRSFMPHRREIRNKANAEFYSVEEYEPGHFDTFCPHKDFTKWAAQEVISLSNVPPDLETLVVPAGLYAVFLHRGPASAAAETYTYIYNQWLPGSGYQLDQRPHLAIMGDKYKNEDPDSEEEIWIPVREKVLEIYVKN